ncbi:MAG: 7-cyano-7-deazaguanine synthase QueC [Planctomycetes bacterium]|nr:7-cyano-7-deazaguanine synthase QueC [Planctomycetota bacterium]
MTAVALLSGGLDSTVAAAAAARSGAPLLLALTVDYGQRAAANEIRAARAAARALGVRHRQVSLSFLGKLTTTELVNRSRALPFLADGELDDARGAAAESMRAVWVPNRNGLFIAIAAAFAESLGAGEVVVGFNREEGATFPDNSAAFLERMSAALELSTLSAVKVVSPTLGLDKGEIVRLGYEIGAPLRQVWSCYAGGRRHCWHCESCRRLERALRAAGMWERFNDEWKADGVESG